MVHQNTSQIKWKGKVQTGRRWFIWAVGCSMLIPGLKKCKSMKEKAQIQKHFVKERCFPTKPLEESDYRTDSSNTSPLGISMENKAQNFCGSQFYIWSVYGGKVLFSPLKWISYLQRTGHILRKISIVKFRVKLFC